MVEVQDWALSSDEWAEGLTFAPGPALRIGFLRGRYEVTKDLPDDAERRVRSGVNSGAKHSGVRRRKEHCKNPNAAGQVVWVASRQWGRVG
jgi:hypothetical protein